jgi:hypothetical protein
MSKNDNKKKQGKLDYFNLGDAKFTEFTNDCGCKVMMKLQPTIKGTEIETKLKYCPMHEAAQDMYAVVTKYVIATDGFVEGELELVDEARAAKKDAEK